MISRSIVLLPLLKAREVKTLRSVEFSKSIFNKLPHREVQSMSVPMLFETKAKENKTVYISYDNRQTIHKEKVHHHFNYSQQLNTANTNTTKSNLFFHTNTDINSQHNTLNQNFNTTKSNLFSHTNTDINNQNSTLNRNINATSVLNKSFSLQKKTRPINLVSKLLQTVNNNFTEAVSLVNKTSFKNQTTAEQINKNVENFIYKTESHVEVRLEQIENKIKSIKQSERTMPKPEASLLIKERLSSNKEIQNISEKVYSLVLKKFEREQRRRGNLYA